MNDQEETAKATHCVFCRMSTPDRFLGLLMCTICRDPSYDFLLVSGVQVLMAPIIGISGRQFMAQEVLMFVVLIFVKHRITPPWLRAR